MIPYWIAFFFIASLSLLLDPYKHKDIKLWFLIGFVFTIFIGLRFEVGGDWLNYLVHYKLASNEKLLDSLLNGGDLGYVILNWLMYLLGFGIEGVNFVSALIFVSGLICFCYLQERPLLAFCIAIPYLVVVVAMGYTRQSIAIGLFLLAIYYLEKGNFKVYVAMIAIAALFHKTAVLLIPLGLFLHGKGHVVRLIAIVLVAYGTWDLLLADAQEDLWNNYVNAKMVSEGASIRVFMNIIPSLLFLLFRRRWVRYYPNFWFWFWISIASIACIPFISFASTAVDRIALYLIPIQVVVFSRLPRLTSDYLKTGYVVLVIIIVYAVVMFVWLNFASHANEWIPYQNILFDVITK